MARQHASEWMNVRILFFVYAAYLRFFAGFAVFAEATKAEFLGAPGEPGFLIVSPLPPAIRFCLALMFAYNPGPLAITFL